MIRTINRKRARPQASPTFNSFSFLALALLLAASQANAFSDSSTSIVGQSDFESYYNLQKLETQEIEYDDDEWEWEIEEADEDEDEEGWEYYYEEEEDEDDDDEDYWTPEQIQEMDALYERYLQKLDTKFGADWQQRFELVVDKEEIYEEYLAFEEQKQMDAEAEEQRLLIEASHKALMDYDGTLRVEDEFFTSYDSLNRTQDQDSIVASLEKSLSADLAPRTHFVVLGTGLGQNKNIHQSHNDKNNNAQECSAKPTTTTTIVTTRGGNTHTVIGSI